MLVAAFYSSLSGLWGVVVTDFIQFIIAMTGCIILAVFIVQQPEIGGIAELKNKLPEGSLRFFPKINQDSLSYGILSISTGSLFAYLGIQWWASWYPGAEPGGGGYVAQRMMSAKNEQHALWATLLFQIAHYVFRPWPWIIVALATLVLYPEVENDKVTYIMAIRDYMPPGLKGLLLASFFAAYMSTISTQLNWGSSFVVNDLLKRFVFPEKEQVFWVRAGRVTTLILMIAAAYVTTKINSITAIWKFILESGAGLGGVLILRWFWWRINAWSEITATIAPMIIYLLLKNYTSIGFPGSYFFTVLITSVLWILVTLITPPENDATITRFIKKIQPEGIWPKHYAVSNQNLPLKILMWLVSVIFSYSLLFNLGLWIFHEISALLILTLILSGGGFIFLLIKNRTG
jgi:Na+/proline symporter